MPLSNCDPGCPVAGAPPVWPGAGFPALGFGGDMPLSNWDPGCPVAGVPPIWPGVGPPVLWFGGVMPLSIWDPGCCGAGAPPLGCAMTQRGVGAARTAMTPTADHSTQIHLLKRKTPPPRLEPPAPPELRSRQVTRPFTNSTIRRWTRSFQVANTIKV